MTLATALLVGGAGAAGCLLAIAAGTGELLPVFGAGAAVGVALGRMRRNGVSILLSSVTSAFGFAIALSIPVFAGDGSWWEHLPAIATVLCTALAYALVVIVAASFVSWSRIVEAGERRSHDRCVCCNYDLRGSRGSVCPECGEPFVRAPMARELVVRRTGAHTPESRTGAKGPPDRDGDQGASHA